MKTKISKDLKIYHDVRKIKIVTKIYKKLKIYFTVKENTL